MPYSSASPRPESGANAVHGKPIPDPDDPLTGPFWAGANQKRLLIQRCEQCARFHHPPVGICKDCLSTDLTFVEVTGDGHVYSFAVVKDQRIPAFDALVPYVVASVELDDAPGVFLQTNLPGTPIDGVRSGLAVTVDFEEISPGVNIPQFRPREGGDDDVE